MGAMSELAYSRYDDDEEIEFFTSPVAKASSDFTVTVGISPTSYKSKPVTFDVPKVKSELANSVNTASVDIPHLIKCIRNGQTFCPAEVVAVRNGKGNFTHQASGWKSQRLFCVDIDNANADKSRLSDSEYITIDKAVKICNDNGIELAFAYKSFSYKDDFQKFRLACVLDETITDTNEREKIVKAFIDLFGNASDSNCKNADRIFFGSTSDCMLIDFTNKTTSKDVFLKLSESQEKAKALSPIIPFPAMPKATVKADSNLSEYDFDIDTLLNFFDAGAEYQEWLAVTVAFKGAGGTQSEWISWCQTSEKWKDSDAKRWDGINGSGNKGALINLAKKNPQANAYMQDLIEKQRKAKASSSQKRWGNSSVSSSEKEKKTETDKKNLPRLSIDLFENWLIRNGYNICYDVITHKINFRGFESESYEHLNETASTILADKLENEFTGVSKNKVQDYITLTATRNKRNIVLETIETEEISHSQLNDNDGWDGIDRIEQIYQMFGIKLDDTLSRVSIRKWLMQCYCALHNDAKHPFSLDIVLVIQGKQGISKTRFFEKLAMGYFSEAVCLDPTSKDSVMLATSSWISELGEMGSTMRKDMDRVKAFLTRSSDEYRPPYGRTSLIYPRLTSFVGTVNDDTFLIDVTGNRRFATISIDEGVSIDYTSQIAPFNEKQLWVQVKHIVEEQLANGHTYASAFRLSKEELSDMDKRNANYIKPLKAEDEILDLLAWAENKAEAEHKTMEYRLVTASDFLNKHDELCKYTASQVGKALQKIGYEQVKTKSGRYYRLPTLITADTVSDKE